MKRRLKTTLFKALALMPRAVGDTAYHLLQKANGQVRIEDDIAAKEESFRKIQSVLAHLKRRLEGQRVLELGSGWLPTLPYLLRYVGKCHFVLTYDTNQHYSARRNRSLNRAFFAQYPHADIPAFDEANFCLPAGVNYFPYTNLIVSPPPTQSVDVLLSRFVLEHVAPADILSLHRGLKKYLRRDGVVIHLVSPSDHRAYSDPSLSLYDFLKYSQAEWDAIQTRFDYHNRMRLPQYRQLFEQAGLEVIHEEWSSGASIETSEEIKRSVHEDFQRFSAEELTAGSLVFALRLHERIA